MHNSITETPIRQAAWTKQPSLLVVPDGVQLKFESSSISESGMPSQAEMKKGIRLVAGFPRNKRGNKSVEMTRVA